MNAIRTVDDRFLHGLDGSNPLAVLAALGTLRTLSIAWPERRVTMHWGESAGAWRPIIGATDAPTGDAFRDEVLDALGHGLAASADLPAFSMSDDLTVESELFRAASRSAMEHAHVTGDRRWADFLAAFGCDAVTDRTGKTLLIQDTALRTMSGAGHQHFLRFMRNLIEQTTDQHLRKALFETWRFDDPVKNMTLRWDPSDDDPYALRWRDPSGDPARSLGGSMWGANRLAIEALPLLPTAPTATGLRTTGFVERGSRGTYWTWPIWTGPASVDAVRSLLADPLIQEVAARGTTGGRRREVRALLAERAIPLLFRSQRMTIGKFRCFTPGRAV